MVEVLPSAPELSVPRATLRTETRRPLMSMEMQAWSSLYQAMHAHEERRPFSRATLARIAGFARPHRRRLAVFLLLSVVGAVLAVATPVLAGRVVDAIDHGGDVRTVVRLAALIAAIAVAEAGLGVVTRWFSAVSARA
jgi:ABC-type bacteriocin/lantibiotic exporter with double-glycine peptidase domain